MQYDLRPLIPLFLAAGCLTEKSYAEEASTLQCEISAFCPLEITCPDSISLESGECERIDREMATICLSALEEMRDDLESAESEEDEAQICQSGLPFACSEVYVERKTRKCKTQDMDVVGRPLLVEGEPLVATVVVGDQWAEGAYRRCELPDSTAAREWLEAARFEHASVAAFARISMELMALAAPPTLVARAHLAALDEIEHARLCLDLARALSGESYDLGALPVAPARQPSLDTLAIEALLEGCVGEGAAALIAQLGGVAAEEEFAAVQGSIAADELTHAQLGWATVGWALSQRPALGERLKTVLARHRELLAAETRARADSPGLRRFGLLSFAEKQRARLQLIDDVVSPTLARLVELHLPRTRPCRGPATGA